MNNKNIINDLLNIGNLKIVQNPNYFMFSLESILLPGFVNLTGNNRKILDLCSGNAPIPLVLSKKTKSKIYAVEIQKEIYDLAKETIRINKLEDQIILINDDVKNLTNIFETDTFDVITCNPPYFKVLKDSLINDNPIKSIARHEIKIEIEDILRISKKLLKNNGNLYLVHRTDRLIDILELMRKYNIEPKSLKFIFPKKNFNSDLFLIMGKKNGKKGLEILSPLYTHNDDGTYTKEVMEYFKL